MIVANKSKTHIGALIVLCAGIIVLLISSFFVLRNVQTIHHYYAIRKLSNVNQIQGWMTLHYISRSYSVPETVLLQGVHVTTLQSRHQSLTSIAASQKIPLHTLISSVGQIILQYKKQYPQSSPMTQHRFPY